MRRSLNKTKKKRKAKESEKEVIAPGKFGGAKEGIFMGENMNAKIPFQDCIEVQFNEDGNIQ